MRRTDQIMTTPDPTDKAATPNVTTHVDPAVAAQVILTEAEYLRIQAAVMMPKESAAANRLDLSPLGR